MDSLEIYWKYKNWMKLNDSWSFFTESRSFNDFIIIQKKSQGWFDTFNVIIIIGKKIRFETFNKSSIVPVILLNGHRKREKQILKFIFCFCNCEWLLLMQVYGIFKAMEASTYPNQKDSLFLKLGSLKLCKKLKKTKNIQYYITSM